MIFLIKLSYNTGPFVASNFCCSKTEVRTLHTPRTSMVPFLALIWLKQPWLQPHEAEVKHSRSPTPRKLMQWKPNMKKTQHSGSDKKPCMLETRIAKANSAKSSQGSVSDSRRPLVGVGSLHPYGWKDIWLKNQFLYNLLFLVFSNSLRIGEQQWVPQGVLKAPLSVVPW